MASSQPPQLFTSTVTPVRANPQQVSDRAQIRLEEHRWQRGDQRNPSAPRAHRFHTLGRQALDDHTFGPDGREKTVDGVGGQADAVGRLAKRSTVGGTADTAVEDRLHALRHFQLPQPLLHFLAMLQRFGDEIRQLVHLPRRHQKVRLVGRASREFTALDLLHAQEIQQVADRHGLVRPVDDRLGHRPFGRLAHVLTAADNPLGLDIDVQFIGGPPRFRGRLGLGSAFCRRFGITARRTAVRRSAATFAARRTRQIVALAIQISTGQLSTGVSPQLVDSGRQLRRIFARQRPAVQADRLGDPVGGLHPAFDLQRRDSRRAGSSRRWIRARSFIDMGVPAALPSTDQGTRQVLVHVPRLPLRPPPQLDIMQRPETEKHNAPCTNTSVWTPGTAEASLISPSDNSRQHDSNGPQPGRCRHVGAVGDTGLGAEMKVQTGKLGLQRQQRRIADQDRIDAAILGQLQQPRSLAQLALRQIDVQRQVSFRTALVGRLHSLGEFRLVKIAGPSPSIEYIQAEIDGVGPRVQSGLEHQEVSGRREQFQTPRRRSRGRR